MPDTSPNLGLPFILPSQAQKHVTHNDAIILLDSLVQLTVQSRSQTTPPGAPTLGQCYIVAPTGTADWLGQDTNIAVWHATGWQFIVPVTGWQAHIVDEMTATVFDGALWTSPNLDLQNQAGIGLGTTYDATNRLAISSEATLLSHAGNGHQLKVNKAAPTDTASLLFQDNWSGRAEIGLTGDDALHFKVSADGTTFTDAITLENQTGFTRAKGVMSGRITIAENAVGTITPPSPCGFILINDIDAVYVRPNHSGIFVYDTTITPTCLKAFAGSKMQNHDNTLLTGTVSAVGNTGISARNGLLQVENRHTGNRSYSYTFLGGL